MVKYSGPSTSKARELQALSPGAFPAAAPSACAWSVPPSHPSWRRAIEFGYGSNMLKELGKVMVENQVENQPIYGNIAEYHAIYIYIYMCVQYSHTQIICTYIYIYIFHDIVGHIQYIYIYSIYVYSIANNMYILLAMDCPNPLSIDHLSQLSRHIGRLCINIEDTWNNYQMVN